jgi:NhaP-type Na+/H+ or K+/H+ antiporter
MVITIFLIALMGYYFLRLNPGEAILLGAILAPTDPVLATEVQLDGPKVDSSLKFSLTTEGGLNDGTAFPFVMLGLGIMAKNNTWSFTDWIQIDLLWAIAGGLGIGTTLGILIFKIANYIKTIKHNYYLEDFLTIGSIALSYGLAIQFKAYGFLAVFANALTFRQIELSKTGSVQKKSKNELPDEVLSFNEQLERIFEVISVVLLGLIVDLNSFSFEIIIFALTLFFIIRPLSVFAGTSFAKSSLKFNLFISWFGVRGIGSIYYLFYALNHKSFNGDSKVMIDLTLWVLFFSILLHGLSTKPLMKIWDR